MAGVGEADNERLGLFDPLADRCLGIAAFGPSIYARAMRPTLLEPPLSAYDYSTSETKRRKSKTIRSYMHKYMRISSLDLRQHDTTPDHSARRMWKILEQERTLEVRRKPLTPLTP